uniref:Uncharacterized protein n=1 Tax=Setaria viridis TaxID=4556 RepID=A0A4U6W6V2_SETVI|nr:hypothetical protein SEVIR_1G083033v2 [Setaria viridis]
MDPSRPLYSRETSMTVLFPSQTMPSHSQQSLPSCQSLARPASCKSPARNWRREFFSCSVQQLVGVAKEISSRTAKPSKAGKGGYFRKKLKIYKIRLTREYLESIISGRCVQYF